MTILVTSSLPGGVIRAAKASSGGVGAMWHRIASESRLGLEVVPSAKPEFSLAFLAGSRGGNHEKAFNMLEQLIPKNYQNWKREKNFVALD